MRALLFVFSHIKGGAVGIDHQYLNSSRTQKMVPHLVEDSFGGLLVCPVMCSLDLNIKSVLPLNLVSLSRIQPAIG